MITGTVSAQDYVEAQAVHRRTVAIWVNSVLGAIGVTGLVLLSIGVKPWGLILLMGGLCGFLGEAIQARVYIPSQARKHFLQFKGIEAPITYDWNSEKFSVRSDRGNADRNWGDILKVREGDGLILLYTTDVLFEIVPKRWFATPAQMDEFRTLARGRS